MDFWLWLVIFVAGTIGSAWYAWHMGQDSGKWNGYPIAWQDGFDTKIEYLSGYCPDCFSSLTPNRSIGPGHFFCDVCVTTEHIKHVNLQEEISNILEEKETA